jgi:hypothetical protein
LSHQCPVVEEVVAVVRIGVEVIEVVVTWVATFVEVGVEVGADVVVEFKVAVPQDANNIAAPIKKDKPDQIVLFFNSYLHI